MPCAPPDESHPTRLRGKAVAPASPPGKKATPIDIPGLKALRDSLPYQEVSGADLIREMRDSRY